MDHDWQRRSREPREKILRETRRTTQRLRWVVRGVVALAVLLAAVWFVIVLR